jgi:murein DD-endopeptidase MepM/ murein hydrolase activator NlpD
MICLAGTLLIVLFSTAAFADLKDWVAPIKTDTITVTGGYTYFGGIIHSRVGGFAIDLKGTTDDARIVAPTSGTVTVKPFDASGYGNWVEIKTDDGQTIRLAHMESISVANGARVSPGDEIGIIGKTGGDENTGIHLHFEITTMDGNQVKGLFGIEPDKFSKDVFDYWDDKPKDKGFKFPGYSANSNSTNSNYVLMSDIDLAVREGAIKFR